MNSTKNLITTARAAEVLGFTPNYVRKLIAEGKIKAVKLGHDWLVNEKSLSKVTRLRKAKESKE